jgi:hypothetical protein
MQQTTIIEAFPVEVVGDPRVGAHGTIKQSGLACTIASVYRFSDGFEQYSVSTGDGCGEYLNADEVACEPVILVDDSREGLLVEKDGFLGIVCRVSNINGQEYIHYLVGNDLRGSFDWSTFQVMVEV